MGPHVMNFGGKGPYLHTPDLSNAKASWGSALGDRTWNSGRLVPSHGDVGAPGGWATPPQDGYGCLPWWARPLGTCLVRYFEPGFLCGGCPERFPL